MTCSLCNRTGLVPGAGVMTFEPCPNGCLAPDPAPVQGDPGAVAFTTSFSLSPWPSGPIGVESSGEWSTKAPRVEAVPEAPAPLTRALARVADLERELGEWKENYETRVNISNFWRSKVTGHKHDAEQHLAWVEALEAERDELRAEVAGLRAEYEAAARVVAEADRYRAALEKIARASWSGGWSVANAAIVATEALAPATEPKGDRKCRECSGTGGFGGTCAVCHGTATEPKGGAGCPICRPRGGTCWQACPRCGAEPKGGDR